MKKMFLGIICLFFGWIGSANAILITTTSNGTWDVTALESAPFSANQALLESQFWWENSTLAQEVAELVLDDLGLPNFGNTETPYYAYQTLPDDRMLAWICNADCSLSGTLNTHQSLISYSYAIATQVAVPEPATLALISLGLAGLGFSRRKKA